MSYHRPNSPDLAFELVNNLDALDPDTLATAIDTYRRAFREEPYREDFSELTAREAFDYVLGLGGYFVFGKLDDRVVTFAGGYPKQQGFYIEELAVTPELQGQGLGRTSLRAFMNIDPAKSAEWLEIRTNVGNTRALTLYKSEGFVAVPPTEAVPHLRSSGTIALDERVYLVRYQDANRPEGQLSNLRRVAVAYPSGNTTALVFDQRLSDDRKSLNSALISAINEQLPELPSVEQCGFVTLPQDSSAIARVEMFGGEFCGNATRSAVWLITNGEDYASSIEVSGVAKPLRFAVDAGRVQLEMPLPEKVALTEEITEGVLVNLDGISHVVVTAPDQRDERTPRELLQMLLANNAYGLSTQPAVGVTYYDQKTCAADFCVWVREVDTIFDETACGSGTSAIGVALAAKSCDSVRAEVIQPSGETISTMATYDRDGSVTSSWISGIVKILFDGEVRIT